MPTLSNELDDIDHIQIKLVDQFITLENKLRHKEIDVETMFKMSRQYHQDAHKDILAIIATQNTALLKEVLKSLPKKMDEGDGWDLAFAGCCPGDDTAHGYNHCLKKTKKVINSKLAAMGEQ